MMGMNREDYSQEKYLTLDLELGIQNTEFALLPSL